MLNKNELMLGNLVIPKSNGLVSDKINSNEEISNDGVFIDGRDNVIDFSELEPIKFTYEYYNNSKIE